MTKPVIHILLPNQLFKHSEILKNVKDIILIEEYLFFKQFNFHKQKIAFHRASMKAYRRHLESLGKKVTYIEAHDPMSDLRQYIASLPELCEIHVFDPVDNWLEKRIVKASAHRDLIWYDNPLFINKNEELQSFFKKTKKKFFQTSFYKNERSKRGILMEGNQPAGGKWTFDTENRKKYPKDKIPPSISFPSYTEDYKEAYQYVNNHFNDHIGELDESALYPINFESAEAWLNQFFEFRFHEFGLYEDAIVKEEIFLHHSVLSPLINTGLLHPLEVVERAIEFAEKNDIPINSTEGFVRQILGWREFIRGVYTAKGTEERTKNFWNFKRKIPMSFYNGTTGIEPIDDVIQKVLKAGYAHHIERLMVVGNFMVLCEFDPDDVYQWFMELFIDAYDWVMVPNVYGMSLFADGGIMSTKPYISSSNYLMKMSNYQKGEWQKTWDGLFWTFMDKHRDFFVSNPRLGMLIRTLDKMKTETKEKHFQHAELFFQGLDGK